MRVLVIGGSGHVGSLILPYLREQHEITVFDKRPPQVEGVGYIEGDLTDYRALENAAAGKDAIIFMAMGQSPWQPGADFAERAQRHGDSFDVNVKGVYFALLAAHQNGITQAVYTSSMSVYRAIDHRREEKRYFTDEDIAPDATHIYGFTKRLGEEVCRNAAREWKMDVNALRLCLPVSEEKWYAEVKQGEPNIMTTAPDVARALLAALEFRCGFQAFTISGDYEEKLMSLNKAKQLLHWEPRARPVLSAG